MTEFVVAVLGLGAGVFTASAVAKLRRPSAYRDYRAGLRATELVPTRLLNVTAVLLVVIEAASAAGLAGGAVLLATRSPGAFPLAESALAAAAAMAALLAAGVAAIIRRGTTARCACFGSTSARPLGAAHLIRNTLLLLALLAGLVCCSLGRSAAELAESALALVPGLVAALLFVRWDDLVSLYGPIRPMTTDRQSSH
jgi:hypothetical protein